MICLTSDEKVACWRLMRFMGYLALLIGIMLGIWWLADVFARDAFSEGGIVENTQSLVLSASALICGWCVRKDKAYRLIFLGLMAVCLFGLLREQDAWLDKRLPVISWRIGFIFPLMTLIYGLKNLKDLRRQLVTFVSMPAFSVLFAAFVMIIPLAQCLGHRPLIFKIMGFYDKGLGSGLRRMIEESVELLGYTLILLSVVELCFNIKEKLKK